VDFKQAYVRANRNKILEIMNYFGMPAKLVKLVSAAMEGTKACVKIQNDLTGHFKLTED
jgi:hypothetical protein